jgi:hypothetical protein
MVYVRDLRDDMYRCTRLLINMTARMIIMAECSTVPTVASAIHTLYMQVQ